MGGRFFTRGKNAKDLLPKKRFVMFR